MTTVHIQDVNGFTLYHSKHRPVARPFDPPRRPIAYREPRPMATRVKSPTGHTGSALVSAFVVAAASSAVIIVTMILVSLVW